MIYERFFGLGDEPFRLTPDPRYLYLSRQHADALAHLRLGLTESSGFVCITGDVGTGKTTLLRTFLDELGPEISTAYVFNPDVTVLELLRTIIGELGIETHTRSRKKLVDALNRHLLAQREDGRRSVVVIDEAQALSVGVLEELRLLSNLETSTEKLLRIMLVGQPQLHDLLVNPALVQLNQRITLRLHLGPLSREETGAYVRHRLGVASDGQRTDLFSRGAIRALHRYSAGVPRLVNMFAHRALLVAFAAERRRVTARAVRAARRELAAVPLPRRIRPRRALWGPVAAGACLGAVVVAAAGVLELRRGDGTTAFLEPPRGVEAVAGAEPAPVLAPVALTTPEPAAAAKVAEPAPPPAAPTLAERLAAVDQPTSARDAVDAVLAAWSAAPLATAEPVDAATLPAVAARRGLEHLAIDGNAGLLRLLDLPAVLELHLDGADGPRWAALVSVGDGGWRLAASGHEAPVDLAYLEAHWLGRAYVFWRDFERLGPTLVDPAARGPLVDRLHGLLERSGVASVRDFQREHRLAVDGLVGPLTRIVLYATVGGYASPSLGGPTGAPS